MKTNNNSLGRVLPGNSIDFNVPCPNAERDCRGEAKFVGERVEQGRRRVVTNSRAQSSLTRRRALSKSPTVG
jgi:hypothetical protein